MYIKYMYEKIFILLILLNFNKNAEAGTWCKAVCPYKKNFLKMNFATSDL